MVYSMTGYGRCEIEENHRKVIVEISAINHRYCDLNIKLPRILAPLEETVKQTIRQKVARGKLEVMIYCYSTAEEDTEVTINETIAKGYIEGLRALGSKFRIEDNLKLSDLVKINDLITIQKKAGDIEMIKDLLDKALESALDELVGMRLKEGEALKKDILFKTETVNHLIAEVEKRSELVVSEYKKKLEARLAILLEGTVLDPARLATEVAILADKCAIDEELTRLKSHTMQLVSILGEEGTVGRKLDFLMQEMNREANTIGSKANDYEITKSVVALKTEIEKIREQIQNIE